MRAYGDAVREALMAVPRAEKVATVMVMAEVPYPLLESARRLVAAQDGVMLEESFAAEITLTARFRRERYAAFAAALRELSHGAIEAIVVEENEATIMPLS